MWQFLLFFWRFFVSGVGGNDSWDLFHPQGTCPEVGGPKSDPFLTYSGARRPETCIFLRFFWGSGAGNLHVPTFFGGRGPATCIFPRFFEGRWPETCIFLGFWGVREAAGGRDQGRMTLECRLTESGLRPIEVASPPKDLCFFSFWPGV